MSAGPPATTIRVIPLVSEQRPRLEAAEAAFLGDHPDYVTTAALGELRRTEFARLDAGGHVYLDYTGSGLAADSQLREHMGRLADGVFGNPHSISPTPAASTRRVERARASMLDYLSAASDE
jgi:selenocysteine lyase/cysteine desulfurase